VVVHVSLDASIQVSGDADRLQQVVSNLVSNAIKFTLSGGRVEISLCHGESQVELAVIDTGVGITPEFLPFVFERFRQADSSSRRAQGGLGIGLALVRHIVELHGGSVAAESAGPQQGSRFMIRLPALAALREESAARLPPQGEHASPPVRHEGAIDLGGLRVLLVEDDQDARELLREVLLQHRAVVTAACSVREALEVIGSGRPDVLVSDLAMPDEDGYELIRTVRRRPAEEGGGIPALALTAHARKEDERRALEAGFQMHAAKPIDPDELIAAVASLAAMGRCGLPACS
jgi:CheY-like chemotaxis protein